MNTYDTSNLPLGSTDVKVLYNNASNLDDAVNTAESMTWVDRFSKVRKSWLGFETDFANFLISSGYEFIGDYDTDGPLLITRANQIFSKDGEYWRASASLNLPYTTVDNWTIDAPKFVSVGDAALRSALASPGGSALIGDGDMTVAARLASHSERLDNLHYTTIEEHGGLPGLDNDCTAALWAAIISLRANPKEILDDIGGGTITAYSSGTIHFGPGTYCINADQLQITQDLGLRFVGQGSRRTNNAVRAATTLLIRGASTGFGIKLWNSGARGFSAEDMDFCYDNPGFAGDMFDSLNCPGFSLTRCTIASYGLSGPERLQTARSCIRATYDEFQYFQDCVFTDAVDGWWSDDVRIQNGNTQFGGSLTTFANVVFYDFTGTHIKHLGNRSRQGLVITGGGFNPITVAPVRCVDLNNISGVSLDGVGFSVSVGYAPSVEWMRLGNATVSVSGCFFNDLARAGSFDGMIGFRNNFFYCTDGPILRGGVITGQGNTFGKATNAWITSPDYDLVLDLGPDLFKNQVTTSYYIPVDTTLISGHIRYSAANDQSTSKFFNASPRVTLYSLASKLLSIPDTVANIPINETGNTMVGSGTASQTFYLPVPVPGCVLAFTKTVSQTLNVVCSGGTNLLAGNGAAKTTASLAAANIGGNLKLRAVSATAWLVEAETGLWTYS